MPDISVNDLVMVVRPTSCCGTSKGIGLVFTVKKIETKEFTLCAYCDKVIDSYVGVWGAGNTPYRIERLKRIPPIGELDKIENEEPVEVV